MTPGSSQEGAETGPGMWGWSRSLNQGSTTSHMLQMASALRERGIGQHRCRCQEGEGWFLWCNPRVLRSAELHCLNPGSFPWEALLRHPGVLMGWTPGDPAWLLRIKG